MAGNYPDVISWRMAYDVDGTQVFWGYQTYNTINQYSGTDVAIKNQESPEATGVSVPNDNAFKTFIFPELRDLDGICIVYYGFNGAMPSTQTVQVSSNTTNGVDGTWAEYPGAWTYSTPKPHFRTGIVWSTALGIKGIRILTNRINGAGGIHDRIHLYGEPAPGENPQRLEIWHPTLDQRIGPADLDWGDVPRNSTAIKEFRIKNMHPTLTANSVRAAMSILTDTAPSVVGQMSLSKDGGVTWAAQQTLTSLAPEAISSVLQIRRQTPSNATLSLWWYRLFADCTSWS